MIGFLLLCSTAFADTTNLPDYTDLLEGQKAPYTGKLFTEEALIKIIVGHENEIEKLKIDHTFKIEKNSADFKLQYDTLDLKYKSETEMYKTMIQVRDDQLRKDSKKDVLQRWGIYGSFILGALTTVAVVHAVDHVE